jgi:hypothetical protein
VHKALKNSPKRLRVCQFSLTVGRGELLSKNQFLSDFSNGKGLVLLAK